VVSIGPLALVVLALAPGCSWPRPCRQAHPPLRRPRPATSLCSRSPTRGPAGTADPACWRELGRLGPAVAWLAGRAADGRRDGVHQARDRALRLDRGLLRQARPGPRRRRGRGRALHLLAALARRVAPWPGPRPRGATPATGKSCYDSIYSRAEGNGSVRSPTSSGRLGSSSIRWTGSARSRRRPALTPSPMR